VIEIFGQEFLEISDILLYYATETSGYRSIEKESA
jgi:hypothetical protein